MVGRCGILVRVCAICEAGAEGRQPVVQVEKSASPAGRQWQETVSGGPFQVRLRDMPVVVPANGNTGAAVILEESCRSPGAPITICAQGYSRGSDYGRNGIRWK
jgi:hypothetical protein